MRRGQGTTFVTISTAGKREKHLISEIKVQKIVSEMAGADSSNR